MRKPLKFKKEELIASKELSKIQGGGDGGWTVIETEKPDKKEKNND